MSAEVLRNSEGTTIKKRPHTHSESLSFSADSHNPVGFPVAAGKVPNTLSVEPRLQNNDNLNKDLSKNASKKISPVSNLLRKSFLC